MASRMRDDFPVHARRFPKHVALAEAQNWRCCYCGTHVDKRVPETHPNHATIDHYKPIAHGGPRRWSNEITACFVCNTGRGTMNALEYFTLVQSVGRFKAQRIGWAWRAGEDINKTTATDAEQAVRRATHAHAFIKAPQFGIYGRRPSL